MNSKGLAAMFLAATIVFFPPAVDTLAPKPPETATIEQTIPICRQSCMNKFGRGAEILLRAKSEDEKKHQKGIAGQVTPTFHQAGFEIIVSVLKNSGQVLPADADKDTDPSNEFIIV